MSVLPWLEGRQRNLVRSMTPAFLRRAANFLLAPQPVIVEPAPAPEPIPAPVEVAAAPIPPPEPPIVIRHVASAETLNKLVDDAMIEVAKLNPHGANAILKTAEDQSPNRHVPSHYYLYETYYAVDLGKPMDPLDVVTGRIHHARALVNAAMAPSGAAGHIPFWEYYETYIERQKQYPNKVTPFGHRSFAVSNDDGLIQEIFKRIGTTDDPYFVEFGVNDGYQCNTTALVYQGWKGLWIEAATCYHVMAQYLFREFIERGDMRTVSHFMTAEYANSTISRHIHPGRKEIDLLSIDVDGNDYWIWKALDCVNPRVVVIEYNSYYAPPISIAQRYEPLKIFNGTTYYGSSLEALSRLADSKGYKLVACSFVGDNAYFVRSDLVGEKFYKPGDTAAHYEPNRGTGFPWCHGQGRGDWDMVEKR